MRRLSLLATAAALVTAALVGAGCGDGDDAASPLDNALGYLPEGAPLVITVQTDPDNAQIKSAFDLLGKSPLGSQLRDELQELAVGTGADFNDEIRPILGNEAVIGAQNPAALNNDDYLGALEVKDKGKAQDLAKKGSRDVGEAEGVAVYQDDDTSAAVHDDVLLLSNSKQNIGNAIKQRDEDDRFREDKLDDALETLPQDALVSAYYDIKAFIEEEDDEGTAQALKVKWVNALEAGGVTAAVSNDKIDVGVSVNTDSSGLTQADVPIASGDQSPAVLRRVPGSAEISVSLRDPAASIAFGQNAARQAAPAGYAEFEQDLNLIRSQADIDVQRDLFAQFTGDTAIGIDVDGKFAFKSQLQDPGAVKSSLDKFGRAIRNAEDSQFRPPRGDDDLLSFTTDGGTRVVFGVVKNLFVAGNDAEKVAAVVAQQTSQVDGAKGALAASADAQAIASELIAGELDDVLQGLGRQGPQAARGIAAPLGEFTGSVQGDTEGLRGKLSLDVE